MFSPKQTTAEVEAVSFLLFLLGLVVFLEKRGQKRKGAGSSHGVTGEHQRKGAAEKAATGPPYPTEEQHRAAEQAYWSGQLWLNRLSFTAAAIAAVAAVLVLIYTRIATSEAHDQAMQARRQADVAELQVGIAAQALIATDRPWIKVVGVSDPKLEVSPQYGFVSFGITVRVRNVGHSPAGSVYIDSKLLTPWSAALWSGPDDSDPAKTKAFCHDVERQPEPILFESLLFPDDPANLETSGSLTTDEIRAARDTAIRGNYLVSMRGPRQEREKLDIMAKVLATPTISSFVLIGCVTYRIPSGQAIGPDLLHLRGGPAGVQGRSGQVWRFRHHASRPLLRSRPQCEAV